MGRFAVAVALLSPSAGAACPVCDSAPAARVRAAVLGPDLGANLAAAAAPFAALAGVAAVIHGRPSRGDRP